MSNNVYGPISMGRDTGAPPVHLIQETTDDLSKYTPYKWYGGFTDKDGNHIKVEGYPNDTR